jgi:hypothetical protein
LFCQGLDAERVDPFFEIGHMPRMARLADMSSAATGLVAPGGSADRITTCPRRSGKEKAPDPQGLSDKRLKGLEPSTFCMASRRSSQLSYSRALAGILAAHRRPRAEAAAARAGIMGPMRARAMPYVGRRVAVLYLGAVVGGAVARVEDGGRRLAVITDEGEELAFELDRATAAFTLPGGQTKARLRFLGD